MERMNRAAIFNPQKGKVFDLWGMYSFNRTLLDLVETQREGVSSIM